LIEWLKNRKLTDWLAVITPVITFCFGIIGSKLLDARLNPLFRDDTKSILTGILAIGIMTLTMLLIVAAFAARIEKREEDLLRIIGTPVELVFEPLDTIGGGKYYKILIDFLKQVSAGDEILIITNHSLDESENKFDKSERIRQLRSDYFKLLMQKARQQGVSYRRIVCFNTRPPENKIKAGQVKQWLLDHCVQMEELRRSNPDRISLKMSDTKISADIFIVTGKVGTIVIDVNEFQSKGAKSNACLIFHNPPDALIIEQLRKWFMEIDGEDGTQALSTISG
jgi:hypothetical protein